MAYSTQEILPSLAWCPTGLTGTDVSDTELRVVNISGVDVVFGKTGSGKLFAVADKCPPTGTSLCIGGSVDGNSIVDDQWGTRFDVFTGEPENWCPSPPAVGGFIGAVMGGPQKLQVFDVRIPLFSTAIEVQVDVNTRRRYETAYWKGILDAQGKDDGTYY